MGVLGSHRTHRRLGPSVVGRVRATATRRVACERKERAGAVVAAADVAAAAAGVGGGQGSAGPGQPAEVLASMGAPGGASCCRT